MLVCMANPRKDPTRNADYDSPWKEILERYFQEFLEFFFPVAYAGLDWSKPYEFLDKVLQQTVRCSGNFAYVSCCMNTGSKQDILELARFIAWIMILPKDLETRFDEMLFQYEENQNMRYVASFEQYFIEKGEQKGHLDHARESVIEVLETRFEQKSEAIIDAINSIEDISLLKQLHREAVTVSSQDEFLTLLDRQPVLA